MSNKITSLIDRCLPPSNHWYIETCNKYLKSSDDATLVDVGCGPGNNLRVLKEHRGMKVAFDTDKNLIMDWVGDTDVSFLLGDAQAVSIGSGVADAVVFKNVLEHLPYPHHALSEVSRILKPGGVLLLSVPHDRAAAILWARPLRYFLESKWRGVRHLVKLLSYHDEDHKREYLVNELARDVELHGLVVVATWVRGGQMPTHGLFGWSPAVLNEFIGLLLPKSLRSVICVVAMKR